MRTVIRPALVSLLLLTLLTGAAYPAVVTGLSRFIFPHRSGGSLIERHGRAVGSELIGQPFDDPRYFWSRPSATGPVRYNAAASAGSNLATTSPKLAEAVRERVAALKAADPTNTAPVPADLVTASGSGLDPHISIAAARYQVARVAAARKRTRDEVVRLVERYGEGRTLDVLGEPRVNVLKLNLALDGHTEEVSTGPSRAAVTRWPMTTQ